MAVAVAVAMAVAVAVAVALLREATVGGRRGGRVSDGCTTLSPSEARAGSVAGELRAERACQIRVTWGGTAGEHEGRMGPRAGVHEGRMEPRAGASYQRLVPPKPLFCRGKAGCPAV